MAIDVAGQCLKTVRVFGFCSGFRRMPEVRGKGTEHLGEASGAIGTGNLRQERFGISIAIGACSPGEQRQAISGIAAQIPGALESDCSKTTAG